MCYTAKGYLDVSRDERNPTPLFLFNLYQLSNKNNEDEKGMGPKLGRHRIKSIQTRLP